jgi:hypothetical protein
MRSALFLLPSAPLAAGAASAQLSTPAADLRTADSLALERTPIGFDSLPPSILDTPALCDTAYTDASTAIVTIWLPARVLLVRDYHGCRASPETHRRFEDRIDEVAGAGERMRPRPSSTPRPRD